MLLYFSLYKLLITLAIFALCGLWVVYGLVIITEIGEVKICDFTTTNIPIVNPSKVDIFKGFDIFYYLKLI